MFYLFAKKFRIESEFTPKQIRKHFDNKIVPFKTGASIIAMSKFIKKYKLSEVYYGYRDDDKYRVSHHQPRKRDGSSLTAYFTVSKYENGSVIIGKTVMPLSTRIFAAIWLTIILFLTLMCYAIGENMAAICCAAIAVIGTMLMFFDRKKQKKLDKFFYELANNTKE